MKILICILFTITIRHISAHDENLPDYITPCDFNNTNLQTCIRTEIVKALPHFAQGIPKYGVKSLDPIDLDNIIINQNNLKINFYKPKMFGLSKVNLTDFNLVTTQTEANFVLGFVGNIRVIADYDANGKILILPIKGKGAATIEAHKVAVNISSKIKQVKDSDNHSHLKLSEPAYKYDMDSTVFNLENLFNGNKELSETTLKFANENWRQLMDDLAPPVIKQICTGIIKNINKLFSKITIKKLVKNWDGPKK